MSFIIGLVGLAMLALALYPVLVLGGQTIAAFMLGKNVARHCIALLACLAVMVLGAVFVFNIGQSQWLRFAGGLVFIALPWAVFIAAKKWVLQND